MFKLLKTELFPSDGMITKHKAYLSEGHRTSFVLNVQSTSNYVMIVRDKV